jgi:putative nucleotidyltransferase with HDIG domain
MKKDAIKTAKTSLDEIAAHVGDLPALPDVALEALRVIEDPEVTARQLQYVILKDPALTARILKIVNSAMYCLRSEVSTVSHAITILGLKTVRSIIMAASVQQAFQKYAPRTSGLATQLLWQHSWGAAIAAKAIAVCVGYSNPEEASTSGLLHDIGKLGIMSNRPREYDEIISAVYGGDSAFYQAEHERFGFTHSDVGALLALKWRFPPQLAEAIQYHHDFEGAADFKKLAAITNLANLFMVSLQIGFKTTRSVDFDSEPASKLLSLSPETLEKLTSEVEIMVSGIENSITNPHLISHKP